MIYGRIVTSLTFEGEVGFRGEVDAQVLAIAPPPSDRRGSRRCGANAIAAIARPIQYVAVIGLPELDSVPLAPSRSSGESRFASGSSPEAEAPPAYFFNPRRCACCCARRMRSVTSSLPMLSSRDVAHLSM